MSVADSAVERRALRLRITGVVQGVGFRPFVYRLAQRHGVAGWVLNAEDGVHVVAEGSDEALARFRGSSARPSPTGGAGRFV